MIEFAGHAARLKAEDFASILALLPGVEEAALRSVIDTETGGSGFDRKGRPSALFERHLFWAELGPGPERDAAAKQGLAYPHWGEKPYPKSSDGVYDEIGRACLIDENAALRSTSWGLGQILGRECGEAGFPDATSMVLAFREGEAAQLMGMVRLIKARKLDAALHDHRWADFARSYNGTGYRRNHYDTKLADSYLKWIKRLAAGWVMAGDRQSDPEVASVQAALAKLGLYSGAQDGIAGPVTQEAVKAFQRSQPGMVIDGIAGPQTKAALVAAVAALAKLVPPPPAVPAPKPQGTPPAPIPHGPIVAGGAAAGAAAGGLTGNFWWALAAMVAVVALAYLISHLKRKG